MTEFIRPIDYAGHMPHTPTVTCNMQDHPMIVYLSADEQEWTLKIDPRFAADKAQVRAAILQLNTFCTAWFATTYMLGEPA